MAQFIFRGSAVAAPFILGNPHPNLAKNAR